MITVAARLVANAAARTPLAALLSLRCCCLDGQHRAAGVFAGVFAVVFDATAVLGPMRY